MVTEFVFVYITRGICCLFILCYIQVYGISSKAKHEVFRNLMRNYEKAIMPKPDDSALGLKFGFTIVSLTIDESTGIAEIFGWEKYVSVEF